MLLSFKLIVLDYFQLESCGAEASWPGGAENTPRPYRTILDLRRDHAGWNIIDGLVYSLGVRKTIQSFQYCESGLKDGTKPFLKGYSKQVALGSG